jgi:APA family basic amino acid/polyamine antiporter
MQTPVSKLSLFSAISVVIGCVIGSGVFVKPAKVLAATGSSNLALLAWILGGLISLTGGLTLAEIGSRIPKTGGVYIYVEELFGKSWGFVCGWVQAIIYGPALSSALALYFAVLLTQFFGMPESYVKSIALFSLYAVSAVTAIGTGYATAIQNLTTMIKLAPIAIIGILGLFIGEQPIFNQTITSDTQATGIGVAILATLWAYDGWVQVSNMGGELENPSKNLPKAFLYGILGVMVAYLLVNTALFHILPAQEMSTLGETAASVAAERLLGGWAGRALSLTILISIFGALNGNVLTMSRVAYAMACRNAFPMAKLFAMLHSKSNTPVNSTAMKAGIATIMVILLDPDRITDLAMFIVYLSYSAVFMGIFIQRKRLGPPAKGEYKVPLYPIMPFLASIGSLYVCYSMVTQKPMDAIVSLIVAASGMPVYFFLVKGKHGDQNSSVL